MRQNRNRAGARCWGAICGMAPVALTLMACGTAPARDTDTVRPVEASLPPALPDSTPFGVHVLALGQQNNQLWVGTYGKGILRLRPRARQWEQITARENDSTSISWDFVNSLAFGKDSTVWYGTVGNGWGRSTDGGRTWRNWTYSQLGPEWQYVAADGIRARGDTVYIATADGLRISFDAGNTWRCIKAESRVEGGATARPDGCAERIHSLPTEYLLSLDVSSTGTIWVGHLRGLSVSTDRGQTWSTPESKQPIQGRVRAVAVTDSTRYVATETEYFRGGLKAPLDTMVVRAPGWPALPGMPRTLMSNPGLPWPLIGTSFGLAAPEPAGDYHIHYLPAGERYRPAADVWAMLWWGYWPISGTGTGLNRYLAGEFQPTPPAPLGGRGEAPRNPLYTRPIAPADGNPYIDNTYRYGSTMGGNFQQHQGVEFNNPAGTPVRAIAAGRVVFAGKAEAGANTVAILHDERLGSDYVFSTYYHNASLSVSAGQRVTPGQVIAQVGNTGRATNDHLHLEVHVAPEADSSKIVNPEERYPPYTVNPQLFLQPMPGTGIVAGRVLDAAGQPIAGARVYGLVQPYPEETPLSFVETYRDRAHAHPLYNENFAIGDVPAGEYMIGTEIGGSVVWRRIIVEAGRVTFVELRPAAMQ